MSEHTVTATDANFEDVVLKAEGPVIVDVWADWCGPCLQIAPIIDELAREYSGRVTFAKLDADDNPASTARYGITAIPTLLVLRDGELQETIHGARPKRDLVDHVEAVLAAG